MRRVVLLVVVAAVALSGCSALSPTGAPLLTVDNRDDAEYRLAVYVLPDVDDPAGLTFQAVDASGDRRSLAAAELRGNASYRNVTLDAEGADVSRVTVRSGATTSAAINVWEPGDATVYVIETTDGTASLVGAWVITCGTRDQEHGITIANGTIDGRSTVCP